MRNKPHIAFFNFPHPPEVNPTLSLVDTLLRRGFRVTYVTSSRFEAAIAALGAVVLRCPQFRLRTLNPPRQEEDSCSDLLALSVRTLANVNAYYERDRPDLILYDHVCYAGQILASKWRVPAIETNADLAFELAAPDTMSEAIRKSRNRRLAGTKVINEFLTTQGLTADGTPSECGKLTIYWYPEEYQLRGVGLGHAAYAGRCGAERPYTGIWQATSNDGRPVLLVSMSTAYVQGPDYFKMCIQALAGLDWHVVLAIGDNNQAESFSPLPQHFEIVQHVPQLKILPHASLLVFMGGPTSTWEAMYHGIPVVMITHGHGDPEAYAEHATDLGIGIHLKKSDTTADNLRHAVKQIQRDCAIHDRVRRMQHIVRHSWGAEETANCVEEFLEKARSAIHL